MLRDPESSLNPAHPGKGHAYFIDKKQKRKKKKKQKRDHDNQRGIKGSKVSLKTWQVATKSPLNMLSLFGTDTKQNKTRNRDKNKTKH